MVRPLRKMMLPWDAITGDAGASGRAPTLERGRPVRLQNEKGWALSELSTKAVDNSPCEARAGKDQA